MRWTSPRAIDQDRKYFCSHWSVGHDFRKNKFILFWCQGTGGVDQDTAGPKRLECGTKKSLLKL